MIKVDSYSFGLWKWQLQGVTCFNSIFWINSFVSNYCISTPTGHFEFTEAKIRQNSMDLELTHGYLLFDYIKAILQRDIKIYETLNYTLAWPLFRVQKKPSDYKQDGHIKVNQLQNCTSSIMCAKFGKIHGEVSLELRWQD